MTDHRKFSEEVEIKRVILFRLMPGEDLFSSLEKIAQDHRMERGVVLSAVGSLKNVVFRNVKLGTALPVKAENTQEIEGAGPFELLSLEGNLFPSESEGKPVIHLHVMLGSPSGDVLGGHLFRAVIFSTAEILIGQVAGSSVFKAKSDVTGLWELQKK